MLATFSWGAPQWLWPAAALFAVAAACVAWAYFRASAGATMKTASALLKLVAVLAVTWCLAEPLFHGRRPRTGANVFFLMADNSQSMNVRGARGGDTRAEETTRELVRKSNWRNRLEQDFEVRRAIFDARVRSVAAFDELTYDGGRSSLTDALESLSRQAGQRHVAGALLFTDGNVVAPRLTDLPEDSPPLFPVVFDDRDDSPDVALRRVSASQVNFEAAPVTITADVTTVGYRGKTIVTQLLDESGEEVESQEVSVPTGDKPLAVRFQPRPESRGVHFYQVRVVEKSEAWQFDTPEKAREATLENNSRWTVVDRGGGPYRVLYVSGRPNWEFKFLRRALEGDEEVDVVGLIRIAKREPKFVFRARGMDERNPLFKGFDNKDAEEAEEYDKPVLVRLGTRDEDELRSGFPLKADELFGYHAVILDDVESEFFTQDQMLLIKRFVSHRGGALLMLGGMESFVEGEFHRTPIGETLPVYLDRSGEAVLGVDWRLDLTREGALEEWVRVRSTEEEERARLRKNPPVRVLNRVGEVKPGSILLATAKGERDETFAALAATPSFGRGRVAALMVGDLWRWHLKREDPKNDDLEKVWRQTLRWLLANVPSRVKVETTPQDDAPGASLSIVTQVRDERYLPLDNAEVRVALTTPDGQTINLNAEPSDDVAGAYQASYLPRQPGPYRAEVVAVAPDGSEVGRQQTGWTSNPAADEHQALRVNRDLLERLAKATGGEVIPADRLDEFVADLPNRKQTISEPWVYPLWHQTSVLLLAIACLIGEWGVRRISGLP